MGGRSTEQPADIVVADFEQRLEKAELMAAVVVRPEGDDGFARRTARHATGDFRHQDGSGSVELEAAPGPTLYGRDGVENVRARRSGEHDETSPPYCAFAGGEKAACPFWPDDARTIWAAKASATILLTHGR